MLDEHGRVRFIIHRVEDVTDFVRLRAAGDLMEVELVRRSRDLQTANEELRAANAAKTAFLSRMSHELRTPPTAIRGFSELLTYADIGTDQRGWAELIVKASKHLTTLVLDILDISRIEAGRFAISPEQVPLRPVLNHVLELLQPLAARSPDLILLDLHLPDLGGEQVMTRLREDAATREIPVVVPSADATGRRREPLLAAGALEYLTKPIEVRALLEVVDRVLAPAPMAARSDGG